MDLIFQSSVGSSSNCYKKRVNTEKLSSTIYVHRLFCVLSRWKDMFDDFRLSISALLQGDF